MEWVFFTDFLQHIDFQFGSISVFFLVLYDLQGNLTSSSVGLNIVFKNPTPFTLAQLLRHAYLPWSKHCTTFPKVPSPKVLIISSVEK